LRRAQAIDDLQPQRTVLPGRAVDVLAGILDRDLKRLRSVLAAQFLGERVDIGAILRVQRLRVHGSGHSRFRFKTKLI